MPSSVATHASLPLQQASEIDLLENQSVLLERVLSLQRVLDSPRVAADPRGALESCNGRFDDLLLQQLEGSSGHRERFTSESEDDGPTAQPSLRAPRRDSFIQRAARLSTASNCSATSLTSVLLPHAANADDHPQPNGDALDIAAAEAAALPLPQRIAVVTPDLITGKLVANSLQCSAAAAAARAAALSAAAGGGTVPPADAVPGLGSSPEITVYETLEEASAVGDAQVVVVCITPGLDESATPSLLLPRSDGGPRHAGVVFVGDVDAEAQEAIFTQFCGWCELVRLPLIASELRRRVATVHAFVTAAHAREEERRG